MLTLSWWKLSSYFQLGQSDRNTLAKLFRVQAKSTQINHGTQFISISDFEKKNYYYYINYFSLVLELSDFPITNLIVYIGNNDRANYMIPVGNDNPPLRLLRPGGYMLSHAVCGSWLGHLTEQITKFVCTITGRYIFIESYSSDAKHTLCLNEVEVHGLC